MDPTTSFCPNRHCPARGHTGQGNRVSMRRRNNGASVTRATHPSAPAQAPSSRLRTSAEIVVRSVTLRAPGCPRQRLWRRWLDERTIADLVARAGRQGQAVHESLVEQPWTWAGASRCAPRQATGRPRVEALALRVTTRVWLGGEGSARDLPLIRRLMERVRRCAACRPLWAVPMPVSSLRAMRETCRARTHGAGRPRLRPWRHGCICQVVKHDARRRRSRPTAA